MSLSARGDDGKRGVVNDTTGTCAAIIDLVGAVGAPRKPGDPIKFSTKGDLTVSGKTKEVFMVVSVARAEGDTLKATGTAPVKMSDFGISPPAPKVAAGAIKTSEDINVTFEWNTKKAQ